MTESRFDDERLRRAFAVDAEPPPSEQGCPADEEIWAASRGELTQARRAEILEHSAVCGTCGVSWRMASAIAAEASVGAGEAHTAKQRRRFPLGLLAAAATIVGIVVLIPSPPPVDSLRESGAVAIESVLPDTQPLPRTGFVLRWSGAPEGSLYTVEIAREDLTVLHRAEAIEVSEYRVPEEALSSLSARATVLWRVEALLPDTRRIDSPVFRAMLEDDSEPTAP